MSYSFTNRYHNQTSGGGGGGGNYGKLREDGTTILRLFTFKHTITEGDYKLGRYIPTDSVKVGDEVEELFQMQRIHWINRQPHTCGLLQTADGRWIGKCEQCDIVQEMRDAGGEQAEKAGKLAANKKFVINCADVTDEADNYEIKLYTISKSVIDKLMSDLESRRMQGKVVFGPKGRDLEIQFDKTRPPALMYQTSFLDAEDCEDLTGMLDGDPVDLFAKADLLPDALGCYVESAPAETKAEAAPVEEKPKAKRRGRKKKVVKEEPKDDGPYAVGKEFFIDMPNDETGEVDRETCTITNKTDDGQYKISCNGEEYVCDEEDLVMK